jgi:hypothetical protein
MSEVTHSWGSDDWLQASLKEAMAEAVPRAFVDAGKSTYTWHSIDVELAALTYDSAAEASVAGIRADSAALRALTFASADVTIELEVAPDAVFGQVVPPQGGSIVVHAAGLQVAVAEIDETGYFVIRPIPPEPFRLLCRTTVGVDVMTGWVSPGAD